MKKTDGRKLDHKTLEEIRVRAVQQVQAGESPEVVIRALGMSRSRIYEWLAWYRSGGWSALRSKPLAGRPRKLSGSQLQWLYQTVAQKNPLQFRFPFALWTREMVRTLLRERFKIKLSVSSVGRLLRQLGLSCQRPLWRASEQDPAQVRRWRQEEYPRIRALARKVGATIYFADESAVRSDYHAGTTWGIRGQTPVAVSSAERYKVNMISAVTPRGHMRFMLFENAFHTLRFVEFLKRLLHGARASVFLILDGHPVHRSRDVQRFVRATKGRLRLFWLPAYAPELNPDEQVWNHVKPKGAGRAAFSVVSDMKALLLALLHSLQKSPAMIRSFFQLPDTVYAAE
jgi:transposase